MFIRLLCLSSLHYTGKAGNISDSNAAVTRGITILLQEPYLLKRTVFDNVAYGLKVRKQHEGVRSRVFEALELVGLPPAIFSKRLWFELSGGEAQRVALASRLVLNPRVLILDETTASVDHESAFLMKEAIRKFRHEYGTSLIVASHDRVWLNSVTDSVLKIRNGRLDSFEVENILIGPWTHGDKGLYTRVLSDGQSIACLAPPDKNATGFLKNSDIMIAAEYSSRLSAQNILEGTIVQMTADGPDSGILVDTAIAELSLSSRLTQRRAEALQLIPGKKVWLVFKASSIRWR